MAFLDEPAWKRVLLLVTAQVLLPPLTLAARIAAKAHPDLGDDILRLIALKRAHPASESIYPSLWLAVEAEIRKEYPNVDFNAEASSIPPADADEMVTTVAKEASVVMLAFMHNMIEGYVGVRKGHPQELLMLAKSDRQGRKVSEFGFEALFPPGTELTTLEPTLKLITLEYAKRIFFSNSGPEPKSQYVTSGRGRRVKSAGEMLREWMDRGSVGAGELACHESIR